MRDHFREIYASEAAAYDALVSREDYQGNLLRALQDICPLQDKMVVEMGAGTGRVTRLLAPHVRRINAFDAAPAMLERAVQTLEGDNWMLGVADNRAMPVKSASADVVIAGWSFGHATGWYPQEWRGRIGTMVGEMFRIVNRRGVVIILETMGTGVDQPGAPTSALADYYTMLEQEYNFTHKHIPTPYKFTGLDEAENLTRFFFGDELADRVQQEELLILPEYTGIWWKQA